MREYNLFKKTNFYFLQIFKKKSFDAGYESRKSSRTTFSNLNQDKFNIERNELNQSF